MKKLWAGVFLLAFLLGASLLNAWHANTSHSRTASLLTQAADTALSGDLSRGITLAEQAKTLWETHRDGVAIVADHQPLETVDGLLSQMAVYAAVKEPVEFAAVCRYAARQVEAVGEAQAINWQNLL